MTAAEHRARAEELLATAAESLHRVGMALAEQLGFELDGDPARLFSGEVGDGERTTLYLAYLGHNALVGRASVHAQMAALPEPLDGVIEVRTDPGAWGGLPAPADRVLYRDRGGDYWTCAPDGVPGMLGGKFWGELSGIRTIGDVEREYGPLHVVPWPGEVG